MKKKNRTDYLRGHGKNTDAWLDASNARERKNNIIFYLKAAAFIFVVALFLMEAVFNGSDSCYDYDCPDDRYEEE